MHIVWLKTELLHPVDKGGRIRTYNMLKALRQTHRVTYVALDDGTADAAAVAGTAEYAHELIQVPFRPPPRGSVRFFAALARNLVQRHPYAIARYRSPELTREITRLVARGDVDVIVCDFLAPSLNVPHALPCRTVLFQHNVEAMIWKRHAEVARDPLRKRYFGEQWRRMRRFEAAECRRFDQVVAVSAQDAEVMRTEYGVDDVSHVPTGVDIDYFAPPPAASRNAHGLVFTGSMDWLPNEDGIRWFVDDVLPLVRRAVPDVTLTVVGRDPPRTIRELAERDPSIRVTGTVPDVRPHVTEAAVFIVPLRIGGGTRLKIFEAMAMERPVVSTSIGAEGLPVEHGQDILLADSAADFADAVVGLLGNTGTQAALAKAAAAMVRGFYAWPSIAEQFAVQIAPEQALSSRLSSAGRE